MGTISSPSVSRHTTARVWIGSITALVLLLSSGTTAAAASTQSGASALNDPTISEVLLDGVLRTGEGFLQILRADVDGDVPSGTVPIIEPFAQSNPGTIRFSRLDLVDGSRITGIARQATSPGRYFLTLCLVPPLTTTCASAVASRVFSVDVAGPPTQVRLSPRDREADAGDTVRFAVSAVDADGERTQLSAEEALQLEASAARGSVGVAGLPEAIERLRDGLIATIGVTVMWPSDEATITVTAIGFEASPDSAVVTTRSLPDSVAVLTDAPVILAATESATTVRGRVLGADGEPLENVTVTGAVSGATTTLTSSDVTGPSGRFTITYTTASASTGSRDTVSIAADAGPLGIGTTDVTVVLSTNGRTPISDLRFNDLPPATPSDPTPVVYDGYAIGGADAIRVTALATVPGAPVIVRSTRGWLTDRDGAAWNSGHREVTVMSDPVSGLATAYLFTRTPGLVDVSVVGATTLTGEATFRTQPAAARSLRLTTNVTQLRSGQSARVTLMVRDVFGTPVPDATVDLAIAGVGVFANGTRRLTATTNDRGTFQTQVSASTAGTMMITATGHSPRCSRGENQYLCRRDEPAPGFVAASGPVSTRIKVTAFRPAVRLLSPQTNQRVSYNEWVRVRATTTDIPPGTRAQLRSGARLLATARVAASGRIEFPPIHAQGRGTLAVTVAGVQATTQVTVVNFSITSVRRSQGSLTFGVVTGVWQPSTRICLTRNGRIIASQRVVSRGRPMSFTVPQRRGNYQVRVASRFGPVVGRASRFVP